MGGVEIGLGLGGRGWGVRRREGGGEGLAMGLIKTIFLRRRQFMRGGFFSSKIDYFWRVSEEATGEERNGDERLAESGRGKHLGRCLGYRMGDGMRGHEKF